MKKVIFAAWFMALVSSCGVLSSLTSTTTIKPQDSFVLGGNEHGKFSATLKNISGHAIDVYLEPLNGGSYSRQTVKPSQTISVNVPENTAVIIENKSAQQADVQIKASGDLNLGMGYKARTSRL